MEEYPVYVEGHFPVLSPVHAVLSHHHPHHVLVLAAPANKLTFKNIGQIIWGPTIAFQLFYIQRIF
jgi:hypothetical protein